MARACSICSGACDEVKEPKQNVPTDQRKKNMGLLAAAFTGHTECLEEFIKAGADVNHTDESFRDYCISLIAVKYYCYRHHHHPWGTSWTPLIYATKNRHVETI